MAQAYHCNLTTLESLSMSESLAEVLESQTVMTIQDHSLRNTILLKLVHKQYLKIISYWRSRWYQRRRTPR